MGFEDRQINLLPFEPSSRRTDSAHRTPSPGVIHLSLVSEPTSADTSPKRALHRRVARRLLGRRMTALLKARANLERVKQAAEVTRRKNWENARDFGTAYRRLAAAVQGLQPKELGKVSTVAPTYEDSVELRNRARVLYENAELLTCLQRGQSLEEAVAGFVRARVAARDHLDGRSLSQALLKNPNTRNAGHLGSALVATHMHFPKLAWHHFAQVTEEDWQRLAPAEYFKAAFKVDRQAAVTGLKGLITDPPSHLAPGTWIQLVHLAFGAKEEKLASELFQVVETLALNAPDDWAETAAERDWLRPWFEKVLRPQPAATVPNGHIALAVLDYKQPDRQQTSSNLGDYVQTLASLTHLVRHKNVRFHGDDKPLVDFVTGLQGRVQPEIEVDGATRDVTLVDAHRDASNYDSIPENTWTIAFGWYMQSIFGRHDFPLHPNLQPIIVSFHINRQELLTADAIAYLKEHGPVGCRDWTTVDLLLSAGVPAFFSGCLTSTVDAIFPDLKPADRPSADAPVIYVDTKAPAGAEKGTQVGDDIRQEQLVPNLHAAVALLERYRREYSQVVTSRLHCYLPSTSIGVDVDFRPDSLADIRFNGLLTLTEDDLARMRDGIRSKLLAVLTAILDGKPAEEVYAIWREVCAQDVAAAMERRNTVPRIAPPSFDVAAACATVRSEQTVVERTAPAPAGDDVHVALALDGNLKDEMRVVVESMIDNCSRPLHLWILCREHSQRDFDEFAALFPEVTTTWLPCDHVDYGPVLGMLRHITVSTMDRLLLPDLLPELDRILYHDIDALPLGDVAELYDWDLQGHPLAGRSAVAEHVISGFSNMYRSAKRLRETPAASHDLVRRMHARHDYDYTAFNAGILVFDLARMRADEFSRDFIPYVELYGMNDQEVLNCYAGPNRAVLPPQWNSLPTQELVVDPKIIHWAGPLKPWKPQYVLLREEWQHYVGTLAERAAKAGVPAQQPAD